MTQKNFKYVQLRKIYVWIFFNSHDRQVVGGCFSCQ